MMGVRRVTRAALSIPPAAMRVLAQKTLVDEAGRCIANPTKQW
jgi:hypothetical protein